MICFFLHQLNDLVTLVRGNLTKLARMILGALIVIEVLKFNMPWPNVAQQLYMWSFNVTPTWRYSNFTQLTLNVHQNSSNGRQYPEGKPGKGRGAILVAFALVKYTWHTVFTISPAYREIRFLINFLSHHKCFPQLRGKSTQPVFRETIGSGPVGNSKYFVCLTIVLCHTSHFLSRSSPAWSLNLFTGRCVKFYVFTRFNRTLLRRSMLVMWWQRWYLKT